MIECFDANSSDHHDPSARGVKESEAKDHDYVSNETELLASKNPSVIVDFDEKAFEECLKDLASHLKDDFSHSSSTSRASSIDDFTFLSFLRTYDSIKVSSVTLDKKIDEILHVDSKNPKKIRNFKRKKTQTFVRSYF